MTLSEFKHELRLVGIRHDPWGTAMEAYFEVCSHLYTASRYDHIPDEWLYSSPMVHGDLREEESYWFELFNECDTEQLVQIGNLLHRYTQYLQYCEQDY